MINTLDNFNNYGNLSTEIGKFNDIQSQLKEGWEILKSVKEKAGKDSDIYKKFEKEYKELYETIKKAFESEKAFSQEERVKIMLELGDMIKLAEEKDIIEKKGFSSRVGDFLRGTNTETQKEIALSFRDKKIDSYSLDESIAAINYLSNNYGKYKEIKKDDSITKGITLSYHTINELGDQYEVRLFQDMLIEKIFGEKQKGFNDKYLKGFNNEEKGNYIMKISDFEDYLKNPSTVIYSENRTSNLVNSNMLANYFLYLNSIGKANITYLKSILSSVKLAQLKDSLEKNPNSIVKNILGDSLTIEFTKNIDDSKIVINKENYKERLVLDPKKVLFINDKSLLLEAVNNIPNLKYKDINNEFKYDIETIESFIKKDKNFNINQIPTNFYKIDVKNKDDLKKIKSLLNIVNKNDALSIVGELSIYLNSNQITEFLKSLDKNNNKENDLLITLNGYSKSYEQISENSISKINEIDINNITIKDLELLNMYIYKFGITLIEDKITQIISSGKINGENINLTHIPLFKKVLNNNLDITKRIIKKVPSLFESLNNELRSNDALVDIYLDSEIKKGGYRDIINAIENINFGDSVGNIMLIYLKLNGNSYELKQENQEKIKSYFRNPVISQKFFRFFEQYGNSDQVKGQINVLKGITDIFGSIEKDFESSKKGFTKIQNNFNKERQNYTKENKENSNSFENNYGEKIKELFSNLEINLNQEDIKNIISLIKNSDSISANQDLLFLLKEKIGWKNKDKIEKVFKGLQNIKIEIKKEEIKKEEEKQTQKLKEAGFSKEEIEKVNKDIKNNILENIKNIKKDKKESSEEYIEKILDLSLVGIDEKIIKKLDKESLKKIIENNIEIEETKIILTDTKTYFKYLERGDFTTPYTEYKAEIDKQTQIINQDNNYTQNVLNNITNNGRGDYIYKTPSGNIDLSLHEVELISTNEKAKENLENFMQTLNDLGLSNLSKYRQDIFKAISNKYTVEFDSKDDFINKTELKLFLNTILSSLGYEINSSLNLEETITKVKDFNNLGLISGQKEIDKAGNSSLEKHFLDKFDEKRVGKIEINKFEESIGDILK